MFLIPLPSFSLYSDFIDNKCFIHYYVILINFFYRFYCNGLIHGDVYWRYWNFSGRRQQCGSNWKIIDSYKLEQDWTKRWYINSNESKSTHANFTDTGFEKILVTVNNWKLPYANYLGVIVEARLGWKAHVKEKREFVLKYRKMCSLMEENSFMSVCNRRLLWK